MSEGAQNEELLAANAERDAAYRRYRELFDAAPDGLLVTDENGKILEANAAAAELLEVPLSRLSGEALAAFVAPQSRRALRRALLELTQRRERIAECDLRLGGTSRHGAVVQARGVAVGERDVQT